MLLLTEEPSQEQRVDTYVAALITRLGIRPTLNRADLVAVPYIQDKIQNDGEAAPINGLSTHAFTIKPYIREPWLLGGGLMSSDGGVLFDLKQVELAKN